MFGQPLVLNKSLALALGFGTAVAFRIGNESGRDESKNIDPKSVEMRISGFGLVPAVYDPKTKLVTYRFTQKLLPKMYTVILTAKVNGKKVETRWDFIVDPARPRVLTLPRSRDGWKQMRPVDSKAVCADSRTFLWYSASSSQERAASATEFEKAQITLVYEDEQEYKKICQSGPGLLMSEQPSGSRFTWISTPHLV
jgi:hypothetical protein